MVSCKFWDCCITSWMVVKDEESSGDKNDDDDDDDGDESNGDKDDSIVVAVADFVVASIVNKLLWISWMQWWYGWTIAVVVDLGVDNDNDSDNRFVDMNKGIEKSLLFLNNAVVVAV